MDRRRLAMPVKFGRIWAAMIRRRRIEDDEEEELLRRSLTLCDLVFMGVGGTLGLGAYVLAGAVAVEQSGPAVTLSFFISGIASALSAISFAEFAARVSKAGSAYTFAYITVGEFISYCMAWNLILEYAIGTASVAKGLSGYTDTFFKNKMQKVLRAAMPINVSFLSPYPDFFAFTMVSCLTALLCYGAKESSRFNTVFTLINLGCIAAVIVLGCFYIQLDNWFIPKERIPAGRNGGEGGFFPFGWKGVLEGAARCFYGYVGYDIVASTGEEAINPKRDIPLSIGISLFIIFITYLLISAVITLAVPYYDQDQYAPLPHVFDTFGMPYMKVIITCGAICALFTSMMGAMYPLPRILYSMSGDGMLFAFFGKVHRDRQTPIFATLISGLLTGGLSCLFQLLQLIEMMSIGTLLAYSIISFSTLILRYRVPKKDPEPGDVEVEIVEMEMEDKPRSAISRALNYVIDVKNTTLVAYVALSIYTVSATILCALIVHGPSFLPEKMLYFVLMPAFIFTSVVSMIIMRMQPEEESELTFKVPLAPFTPCASMFMNIFLMMQLELTTWIRFLIWLAIGLILYFAYSINHSKQGIIDAREADIENAAAAAAAAAAATINDNNNVPNEGENIPMNAVIAINDDSSDNKNVSNEGENIPMNVIIAVDDNSNDDVLDAQFKP